MNAFVTGSTDLIGSSSCSSRRIVSLVAAALVASCASRDPKTAPEPLVPARTALVLVEFQNEWLSENGHLHQLIRGSLIHDETSARGRELLNSMRRLGVLVVHAPLVYSEDYREIARPRGLQREIVERGLFKRGSTSAAIHADFAPLSGEPIAVGRTGLSAFRGSDLDEILRRHQVDTLIFAGFATNVCVTFTAADAFDRGYDVILAREAVATLHAPEILTRLGVSPLKTVGERLFAGALGEVLDNRQIVARLEPTRSER